MRWKGVAALLAALCVLAPAAPVRAAAGPVEIPTRNVVTLLFHQVTASPIASVGGEDQVKKPWLTPAAFDALLTSCERAGYTVVSLPAALAYLTGDAAADSLPARPLLLTFDDGYESAWTEATPILRRHGAVATMFFEGQLTGTKAGRLTPAELRAMAAGGVWSLQSHGWMGHAPLQIDAGGTRSPYWYANLAWLPDAGRLETRAEFRARVTADLRRFRTTFEPLTGAPIRVFAYPSGEFGQNDALRAGGDPKTKLEAGHSNAMLRDDLRHAVVDAGYDAAFAVSIPGNVAPASPANDAFAIPRLGVGEDFRLETLTALATTGSVLPEILDDRFADPGPLAVAADGTLLVAATAAPALFRLSPRGRPLTTWRVPRLDEDRAGRPTLVGGIEENAGEVSVVQQAGWWPAATPWFTRLRLEDGGAVIRERRPMASASNWLVGLTRSGGRLVGMTDDGQLYDVERGAALGRVTLPGDAAPRANRFAGPAAWAGGLYVYDRTRHEVLDLTPEGALRERYPLAGDIRSLAVRDGLLYCVDAADNRHMLRRFRMP